MNTQETQNVFNRLKVRVKYPAEYLQVNTLQNRL